MAGKKRVPARSKGPKEKKPEWLTKKQWITLGICVAAAVVLLVAYLLLRDLFDGSLKVADGVVQAEDGWVVVNNGTTDRPKYFKLGEVQPVDGYRLEEEDYLGDENVPAFYFYPEGESPVDSIGLLPAKGGAQEMAERAAASYGSFFTGAQTSQVAPREIAGKSGWGFTCAYESSAFSDEATQEENKPGRVVNLYFDAPHGVSVLISATASAADAASVADEAALLALMEPVVESLTIAG